MSRMWRLPTLFLALILVLSSSSSSSLFVSAGNGVWDVPPPLAIRSPSVTALVLRLDQAPTGTPSLVTQCYNSSTSGIGLTETTGSSAPVSLMQPSLTLTHCIIYASSEASQIGDILLFPGNCPSSHSSPCLGQQVLVDDYPDLYDVIGAAFGPSDGTRFYLPDLRDRPAIQHVDGNNITFGVVMGSNTFVLTSDHLPVHVHNVSTGVAGQQTSAAFAGATLPVSHMQAAMPLKFTIVKSQPSATGDIIGTIRITARQDATVGGDSIECDGRASDGSFDDLAALLGTAFGASQNLPDLRGRLAVGSNASSIPYGSVFGTTSALITADQLAAHSHVTGPVAVSVTGASHPHDVSQPSLAIRYIIAAIDPTGTGDNMIDPTSSILAGGTAQPYYGSIVPWSLNTEPAGWMFCDGRSLSRSSYPDLYKVLGTSFGTVDSASFSLPDLTGRVPIGTTNTITVGTRQGASAILMTEANLPQHQHESAGMIVPSNVAIQMSDYSYRFTLYHRAGREFTSDTCNYTLSSETGTFTLPGSSFTFRISNLAANASADSYDAYKNSTLTVAASGGIFVNDQENGGAALSVATHTQPSHGQLVLNKQDGSFSYQPSSTYYGLDSFTYVASNVIGNSSTTSVTLMVWGTIPVANNDVYQCEQNGAIAAQSIATSLIANDVDPDQQVRVWTLQIVQPPQHAGYFVYKNDGTFTYNPTQDYIGSDSFAYRLKLGGRYSNVANVTITVLKAIPIVRNDTYVTFTTDPLVVAAPGIAANDEKIGFGWNIVRASAPSHGSIGSSDPIATGGFTYTPNANFQGVDIFSYQWFDGTDYSSVGWVVITVKPVSFASAHEYAMNFNTRLSVVAPGLTVGDTLVPGWTLQLVTPPVNGTLGASQPTNSGAFTYTPNIGFFGNDTFTYRYFDGTSKYSNVGTVLVAVLHVPTATNKLYALDQDATLNITAPGLTTGDQLVDGWQLILLTPPSQGTLGNGQPTNAGEFVYTPNGGYSGVDTFTYQYYDNVTGLSSNTATVTLSIGAIPIAYDDAYDLYANTPLVVTQASALSANDTLVANFSIVLVSGPTHGTLGASQPNATGAFTYTPTSGYIGTDSFTYQYYDGSSKYSNIATVTLTILPVPVAANSAYTLDQDASLTVAAPGVTAGDSLVTGWTIVLVNTAAHGSLTLDNNGSFVYTPTTHYNGVDTFTYRYSAPDGSHFSNTATVTLTITPIPVAGNHPYSTFVNVPMTVNQAHGLTVGDTLVAGWTIELVASPSHGTLGAGTPTVDGAFTYTPAVDFVGEDEFTYRYVDGTGRQSNSGRAVLSVLTRTLPTAKNYTLSTNENTPLVATSNILIDALAVDGWTVRLKDAPQHGSLGSQGLTSNGTFTYTPSKDYTGDDYFTYHYFDGYITYSSAGIVHVRINSAQNVLPGRGETLSAANSLQYHTAWTAVAILLSIFIALQML